MMVKSLAAPIKNSPPPSPHNAGVPVPVMAAFEGLHPGSTGPVPARIGGEEPNQDGDTRSSDDNEGVTGGREIRRHELLKLSDLQLGLRRSDKNEFHAAFSTRHVQGHLSQVDNNSNVLFWFQVSD